MANLIGPLSEEKFGDQLKGADVRNHPNVPGFETGFRVGC